MTSPDLEPHRDRLLRFCRGYLEDAEAAADAVQETFRRYLAQAAEGRPAREPRAWLLAAARNLCLNELRARRRRRDREPLPTSFDAPAAWTGPLTRLLRAERAEDAARRVAALSEEERELLRLRYFDELSRAEIAALLGLAESVVKSRLFEAIEKLRRAAP
jgi:RNA polymerase sigma-70 factor (ECF subfamily)